MTLLNNLSTACFLALKRAMFVGFIPLFDEEDFREYLPEPRCTVLLYSCARCAVHALELDRHLSSLCHLLSEKRMGHRVNDLKRVWTLCSGYLGF